jgi:hypothetical protein
LRDVGLAANAKMAALAAANPVIIRALTRVNSVEKKQFRELHFQVTLHSTILSEGMGFWIFALSGVAVGNAKMPPSTPPVPKWTPTWVMSESTVIMPCNDSGYTDPAL